MVKAFCSILISLLNVWQTAIQPFWYLNNFMILLQFVLISDLQSICRSTQCFLQTLIFITFIVFSVIDGFPSTILASYSLMLLKLNNYLLLQKSFLVWFIINIIIKFFQNSNENIWWVTKNYKKYILITPFSNIFFNYFAPLTVLLFFLFLTFLDTSCIIQLLYTSV